MKQRTLMLETAFARKFFHVARKIDKLYWRLAALCIASKEDAKTHLAVSYSLFDFCEAFAQDMDEAVNLFQIKSDPKAALGLRSILKHSRGIMYAITVKSDVGRELVKLALRVDRLVSCVSVLCEKQYMVRSSADGFITHINIHMATLEGIYRDMQQTERNIIKREKYARSFFKMVQQAGVCPS